MPCLCFVMIPDAETATFAVVKREDGVEVMRGSLADLVEPNRGFMSPLMVATERLGVMFPGNEGISVEYRT